MEQKRQETWNMHGTLELDLPRSVFDKITGIVLSRKHFAFEGIQADLRQS